ncbi:MAG: phosphonopyruvate decarboxylase [Promethearchaeota archaeon]
MISCQDFFNILKTKDISFFTGIPDSTFKDWMNFLSDKNGKLLQNIIPCNECEAVALGAGYYLATNKVGVVYMQNSGLGKAVNPLVSLCDVEIYSIPLLLMIGWRGEPGLADAPQHKKMGKITLSLLDTLNIPYIILEPNSEFITKSIEKAVQHFEKNKGPFAFIIKPNFFQTYEYQKEELNEYDLTREEYIKIILDSLDDTNVIIISTTGYTSRELFEYLLAKKIQKFNSFFNIGSMGCASSIGLSISLQKKNRVLILDGDGASIMQMGVFTTIGKYAPKNLIHIIFDNRSHESTGGQPTNSATADLVQIALASNYKYGKVIKTKNEMVEILPIIKNKEGPIILVIKTKLGSRSDLARPNESPIKYKEKFMDYLNELK